LREREREREKRISGDRTGSRIVEISQNVRLICVENQRKNMKKRRD